MKHDLSTSIFVNASAGSGKTSKIVERIHNLIEHQERGILCITFTRAAADEIKSRLKTDHSDIVINTIHGFCQMINPKEIIDEHYSLCLINKAFNQSINIIEPIYRVLLGWTNTSDCIAQAPYLPYITDDEAPLMDKYSLKKAVQDILQRGYTGKFHMHKPTVQNIQSSTLDEPYKTYFLQYQQGTMSFQEYASIFLTQQGLPRKRLDAEGQKEAYRIIAMIKQQEYEHASLCNKALEIVCNTVKKIYDELKQNKLDYFDLLNDTYNLLYDHITGPEILSKLNIKHILIDEAQDTNCLQWDIIKLLSENAIMYIVGDDKQSIFSFQGANSNLYIQTKEYFKRKMDFIGQPWRNMSLNTSFRTSKNLLSKIDSILEKTYLRGTKHVAYKDSIEHECFKIIHTSEQDRPNIIADICGELDGSVMILLQRRSDLMDKIISSLDQRSIKNTGYDRIHITDSEMIRLSIEFAKGVIDPQNLLSLNIGVQIFSNTLPNIAMWRKIALYDDAYYFFSQLGKTLSIHSLKLWDIFLSLCVNWELPLREFIYAISEISPIIKLDNNIEEAVKILTIHGAKGLEADHVIIADPEKAPIKSFKINWINDMPYWGKSDDKEIEQEYTRMLYVALTRAKKTITVINISSNNTGWMKYIKLDN